MIKLKGKTCNKPHIYKITNDTNGKFYYGVHNGSNTLNYESTSSVLKKSAYKKYGKENFTKEVLLWFNTEKEAYEYEGVIVNQAMVDNPMCYNLKVGGSGGFDHVNSDVEHQRMAAHVSFNKQYETKTGLFSDEAIAKAVATKKANGSYHRLGKKNAKHIHKHVECPKGCGYKNNTGNLARHNCENWLAKQNRKSHKEKQLCKWGCGKSYNPGNLKQHEERFCKEKEKSK